MIASSPLRRTGWESPRSTARRQGAHVAALVVSIAAVLLAGCGNHLDRGEAAKLLKQRSEFPIKETQKILLNQHIDYIRSFGKPPGPNDVAAAFEAFRDEGLVTIVFDGGFIRISLTDKGRQYVVGSPVTEANGDEEYITVVASTLEFGEITGIVEDKASAEATVEYTLSRNPTPFGRVAPPGSFSHSPAAATFPASPVKFKKYDDGWRAVE